ncbi:MAG: monovalent cation/H(+) antiporter subunit G [Pseudomonadota bacterium]
MDLAFAVEIISWVFILGGSFFVLVGALGFIRMPDVYTRMHAASVIETLGAGMLITGMLIQAPNMIVAFKLIIVAALFFFFGPVASHAIAQAALTAGVTPILDEDRRDRVIDDPSEDETRGIAATEQGLDAADGDVGNVGGTEVKPT